MYGPTKGAKSTRQRKISSLSPALSWILSRLTDDRGPAVAGTVLKRGQNKQLAAFPFLLTWLLGYSKFSTIRSLSRILHLGAVSSGLSMMTTAPKPKLVAFDLDGTIWSPDMYMLWGGGSPFKFVNNEELRDCSGAKVKLLGISGEILDTIATDWQDTKVAWVSCTDEPTWADECMKKFKTPMGIPLVERVDEQCIYKANKQTHFRELQKRTGIAFEDMIFFDNERGNIISVEQIGVCSIYCPNGMTRKIWESGIKTWSSTK